jgi:hypothetical protein
MKKQPNNQASIRQKVRQALITAAPSEAESVVAEIVGSEVPGIAELAVSLIGGQIENRSSLYVDNLYSTFANNEIAREFDEGTHLGRRDSEKDGDVCAGCEAAETPEGEWVPLDELEEIGTQECGPRCRCELSFDVGGVQFATSDLFGATVTGQDRYGGNVELE